MKRTVRLFILLAALLPGAAGATLWNLPAEPPVRIGALSAVDLEEISSQEAILLDRLRRELHPQQLTLRYYTAGELVHAVKSRSVDFFISDAAFYAALEHGESLLALAGLVCPEAVDADHMAAGTVFTAGSGKGKPGLAGVRGMKALLLQEGSFGGDLAVRARIAAEGLSPDSFFSSREEVPSPALLVRRVLSEEGTAGILPACSLERLAAQGELDLNDIAVAGADGRRGLSCLKSTAAYPGWVLAAPKATPLPLVLRITSAALAGSSGDALRWSLPPRDFEPVHNVLIDLGLPPYDTGGGSLWRDFLHRYRMWMVAALAAILAVVLHSLLAARLVRIRTRDIRNLMLEQQRMNEEVLEARTRMQSMEKVQTVSQLSMMVAHELKQPLAAIRNFSLGLQRRSERGELDEATMRDVLGKIIYLTDSASKVVTHVRSYARSGSSERRRCDLAETAQAAVQTFHRTAEASAVRVTTRLPGAAVPVWINSWEIELVVFNLLKNAAEAVAGMADGEIAVSVEAGEHSAALRVSDNGARLGDEAFAGIFRPMRSTKKNGLGLGLAIAVRVAESHGGRINAVRNPQRGLTMELVLPLDRSPGEGNDGK